MANRPGSTVVKGRNRLLLDLYQVLLGRQSLRVAQREPPISGCSVSCQPVAGLFWLHAPWENGAWSMVQGWKGRRITIRSVF